MPAPKKIDTFGYLFFLVLTGLEPTEVRVKLLILCGFSHSAKWDSEVNGESGGVGEADVACTKKK